VTALYLLGRKVWGEMTAVIAATLLSGAHFHLHYSRLGMTNIWDPLLVLLAVGSILWLWQRPSDAPYQRGGWLLSGLFIGLGGAGFTSSRLLPIMLAALFIWVILFDRSTLRQQRPHLGAAFLLTLVTTLPYLLFYRSNPTLFMERANALGIFANQTNWLATQAAQSGLSEGQILWNQLRTALLSFNIAQDLSPAYRPMTPLLSFGPAVLFVLGTLVSLLRLRDLKHAALLIWLLTTILFAGAFLVEVPQSHRLLIATPALTLLAAIAMREIAQVAWTAVNPTHPWLKSQFWPFVLLAVLLAANEAAFYYGRFPLQHQYADTNTETAAVLADYMVDLEGEWTVYFYAAQ
jgi:4-amino-4-deoxy-L-arabinose transferase-like glycosyltransferase